MHILLILKLDLIKMLLPGYDLLMMTFHTQALHDHNDNVTLPLFPLPWCYILQATAGVRR